MHSPVLYVPVCMSPNLRMLAGTFTGRVKQTMGWSNLLRRLSARGPAPVRGRPVSAVRRGPIPSHIPRATSSSTAQTRKRWGDGAASVEAECTPRRGAAAVQCAALSESLPCSRSGPAGRARAAACGRGARCADPVCARVRAAGRSTTGIRGPGPGRSRRAARPSGASQRRGCGRR
jgi:hypothetical protein